MTTTFDPPELKRFASLLIERSFHAALLEGKQDWALRNFVAPVPGGASGGSEVTLRDAQRLRAELVRILAGRGLRVRRRGCHAHVSVRPEPLAPYTVPASRDDVRKVEGHVVLWALRTDGQGYVPIHRCGLLSTRSQGGRNSIKVEYVVGRPDFTSIPESWCLRANLEDYLNGVLSENHRFTTMQEAIMFASLNVQPYVYFEQHRLGTISDDDVDQARLESRAVPRHPSRDEPPDAMWACLSL